MHTPYAVKRSLRELMKFKDHKNYIEMKKHEFKHSEKMLIFYTVITFLILIILQLSGIRFPTLKAILGMSIFIEIGSYAGLLKLHKEIIRKLYTLKDRLHKSKKD